MTIEDVYQHFRLPHDLSVQRRDVIQAEITLERESIYPISAMVSHIQSLLRSGHRVIIMADTYLPSAALRPILMDCGIMEKGEALYVSCDVGVSKHRGQLFHYVLEAEGFQLFHYVLEAEGLDATQLIHGGDNLHADIRMASRAEIETRHLRVAKGKESDYNSDALDHVLHGIVIPFLLAYVIWILDHAKKNGICRLYFVARDGEILYRIAQKLQDQSDNIELRYLYGSRQAWIPASITPVSSESKNALHQPEQSSGVITRFDLLSSAGLADKENEAIRERLGLSEQEWHTPVDGETATKFLSAMAENEYVPCYSSCARQGKEVLAYLRQEGLFDTIRWALVDVGWKLSCQAAVARILDFAGDSHQKPTGLYVGLSRNNLDRQITGPAHTFVQQVDSIFFRRGGVVEKLFTPSTHATTHCYRQRNNIIEPVFGPELRSPEEMIYTKRLHAAAMSAAAMVAGDACTLDSIRKSSPQIIANAAHFLRHPDPKDISQLASFRVDIDPRHEYRRVHRMCEELSISNIWDMLRADLARGKDAKLAPPIWIEGSAAISPWWIRYPMLILLRIVEVRDWFRERDGNNTR